MARHVLLELELDQERVARGTRRDRTARLPDHARIAHAAHICCVQVLLARTHQWQHARRRAAGHVRRVGDAPQSFVRVSRKRCAPC